MVTLILTLLEKQNTVSTVGRNSARTGLAAVGPATDRCPASLERPVPLAGEV
jgi:hypothetical protein